MKGGSKWGSMFGGGAPPTNNSRKFDGDEDLLLFRDIHKRDKERMTKINLLQPDVSEDFDFSSNSGNYSLYRIPSAKKIMGMELPMERGKNDFDWLKTPPATPLFPSLEMEANAAPELAVQREISVFQPLTRFSGNNMEASKLNSDSRSKTPIKPNEKVPSRSVTPISLRSQPKTSTDDDHHHGHATTQDHDQEKETKPLNNTTEDERGGMSDNEAPPNLRTTITCDRSCSATRGRPNNNNMNNTNPTTKSSVSVVHQQQSSSSANRSSSASRIRSNNNGTTITQSSSIDHLVVQQQSSGCSNLRTSTTSSSRSYSASRDRPNYNSIKNNTITKSSPIEHHLIVQQQQSPVKPMRQSCSPSMSRGRKSVDSKQQQDQDQDDHVLTTTTIRSRGRIQQSATAGNGNGPSSSTNVFGSKMVEKVMNARKLSSSTVATGRNQDHRETNYNPKVGRPTSSSSSSSSVSNETSGLGRPKITSFDMALKHNKETTTRKPINIHQTTPTKNATTTASNQSSTRRALDQIRCLKVDVKQTGEKKETRRKFNAK